MHAKLADVKNITCWFVAFEWSVFLVLVFHFPIHLFCISYSLHAVAYKIISDQRAPNLRGKHRWRRRPNSCLSCKIRHDNLMIYVLNYAQISGLKTLGENIADLGGVNLAYHVRFQAFYDYLFQKWQNYFQNLRRTRYYLVSVLTVFNIKIRLRMKERPVCTLALASIPWLCGSNVKLKIINFN